MGKPATADAPQALSGDGALWAQLTALHARVGSELHHSLSIGYSEFLALLALTHNEYGELRMQELAEATSLNPSSVSRLVVRLERDGLTERRTCEQDRRGVYTGITEAGREALDIAIPAYEQALATAFAKVADDPALGPVLARLRADA